MISMEHFVNFDEFLTEEQQLIKSTIREFVDNEIIPTIETHHRNGTFPLDLIPRMANLGIFGAGISAYDLPGLDSISYGLIMQELERGDSAIRSFASVQNALVIFPIYHFGSKSQQDYWIPYLSRGEKIGCMGLTEPDFGSNPGAMRTRLKKSGDGYVLNGSKAWITNGSLADVALIWAKDDQDKIRGVLVEKGAPGYSTREYEGKFSLRASDTSALYFEDCFIKEEHILPKTSNLGHPFSCLNEARFSIAWGTIGAAIAVAEHALEYSKVRIQFDRKPIASHQLVQDKLVFMVTEIAKAQTLIWHLSKLRDKNKLHRRNISLAKRNNVWMARECARLAREILGAAGIVDDHPVIRHMLNLEAVYTYEGTHDIHSLIIGEQLTGIPAFR